MLFWLAVASASSAPDDPGMLKPVVDTWSDASAIAGIFALLLVLRLLSLDVLRCYRLFRSFHSRTLRGSRAQAWVTILWIALTDKTLFARDSRTMLRRLRVQVEQEIFFERPLFAWPDPDVPIPASASWWDRRRLRAATLEQHRAHLDEWRARIRAARSPAGNWVIVVDHPAEVSGAMDRISHYFACVAELGVEGEEADRFLCPIEILSGFVTPLHLLTGLLVKFNEKWPAILESFNRDANDWRGVGNLPGTADFRQIQMFIYNCWMLWGPSVPICTCRNWHSQFSVIQYGYGDENNSIELAGDAKEIATSLADLVEHEVRDDRAGRNNGENAPELRPFSAMAIPAKVQGRLRLSGSIASQSTAAINALPRAARVSWGGEQDERPVLFISEIVRNNMLAEATRVGTEQRGRITLDDNALPSRYYSAYLWVAFALVGGREGDLQPLSKMRGKDEPWKDFIPFFEHGNLADAETCAYGKRQLAAKAVAAIARIVRDWPSGEAPFRFAFACSIDEAGCGHDLAFPDWGGGLPMRQLLKEALEDICKADPANRRLASEGLILFDHFTGKAGQHAFSSCSMPAHIRAHYERMKADGAED